MAKIKLLRNTIVDGEHVDAHQIATCSDATARTLISMGKAVIATDADETNDADAAAKAAAKAAKKAAAKAAKNAAPKTDSAAPVKPAAQDVINALIGLDQNDDTNYEDDMATPKLSVVSALCGRDVTAEELEAALQIVDADPAE